MLPSGAVSPETYGVGRRGAVRASGGLFLVAILAVALLGLAGKAAETRREASPPSLSSASALASPAGAGGAPGAAPAVEPADASRLLGRDGRLTLLLLGSDERAGFPGVRTDAMIVVSVEPRSGAVSVVSLPRDVAHFPLPGGRTHRGKLNTLYASYLAATREPAEAGRRTREAMERALRVEIDAYVLARFDSLIRLVDAVGGVEVRLEREVTGPSGVLFPAGVNRLDGPRALAFARTRKGDSDFERARRQQILLLALARKIRGGGAASLPGLVAVARRDLETDLRVDSPLALFAIASRADLGAVRRTVLGPSRYAEPIGGTSYRLKLDAVRRLTRDWFRRAAGDR